VEAEAEELVENRWLKIRGLNVPIKYYHIILTAKVRIKDTVSICGKKREENSMANKQGYYAREDESVGMRLGKSRSKKSMKRKRDESYGLFGKRKVDWSNHQQG